VPWIGGFPQALPEIKNGKVADHKKVVKRKNLSFVSEFKRKGEQDYSPF